MTAPDLRAFVRRRFGKRWIVNGQVQWRALLAALSMRKGKSA